MVENKNIICRKVAVVVLGYNSINYLKEFLPTILATAYDDFTTVYVDNASVDDSVEYVETHFPEIKIFRIYENHGFTNGYEESLPHIQADYYVLLNSDVRVHPNWLLPDDEGDGKRCKRGGMPAEGHSPTQASII